MTETENPTSAEPTTASAAETTAPRVKRRRGRAQRALAMRAAAKRGSANARSAPRGDPAPKEPRPPVEPLDPLEAAQEAQRHAQEGNLKLSKAVETLRDGLETIAFAETDRQTGLPVSTTVLRRLAVACLDRYSAQVGQNWRKAKLTGATRAGTTGNRPVHEREMGLPREE